MTDLADDIVGGLPDVADVDWRALVDPDCALGRALTRRERDPERVSAFNNYIERDEGVRR